MSQSKRIATTFLLAVALSALPAAAQTQVRNPKLFSVSLKGGGAVYTSDLNRFSKWGPTWGLTFGVQPLSWLGVEGSYDGSRNDADLTSINVSGVQPTAFWRHGGTALLKFSLPLGVVRPFIGGGFGVFGTTPTTDGLGLFQGDLHFEAPVAAGVEFSAGAFLGGVRATYRWLLRSSFVQEGSTAVNGGLLDLQATVGVQF